MSDLTEALMAYTQADEDGVIVKVSRQALHESVARIEALEAENDAMDKALVMAGRIIMLESVSYTHLTLPTILLV